MQLSIDLDAPPLPVARAIGHEAAERAAERAERADPSFRERAMFFVVAYLERHGQASGESITDAAKAADICPPDDRAFGAVYAGLVRQGLIVCAGFCPRRKGHGTAGGRVWRLA